MNLDDDVLGTVEDILNSPVHVPASRATGASPAGKTRGTNASTKHHTGWDDTSPAHIDGSTGHTGRRRSQFREQSDAVVAHSETAVTSNLSLWQDDEDDSGDDMLNVPVIPDRHHIDGANIEPDDYQPSTTIIPQPEPVSSTMVQLDSALQKQPHRLLQLTDIDLKLLSRFLSDPEHVRQDESVWSWDSLFTEVLCEQSHVSCDESERYGGQNINTTIAHA